MARTIALAVSGISLSLVMACGGEPGSDEEAPGNVEQAQLGDVYDNIQIFGAAGPYADDGSGLTIVGAAAVKNAKSAVGYIRVPTPGPGECFYTRVQDNPPPVPSAVFVDVGRVTIKGGLETVTLLPDPTTHRYQDQEFARMLWKGGDRLTIIVQGNPGEGLPGYRKKIIVPEPVALTTPQRPANGSPLVVDTTQPFEFEWEGGHHGYVSAHIGVFQNQGGEVAARCLFPASVGHGTIPASILGLLPKGPPQAGELTRNFDMAAVLSKVESSLIRLRGVVHNHQIYGDDGTDNSIVVDLQ